MTVEFTGRDLAEAIAAAAGALNLPREKLKFSVVAMGAKGFLGLGRRRARIAVDPADPTLYPPEEDESAPPAVKAAETPKPPKKTPPEAGTPPLPEPPPPPRPAPGAQPLPELSPLTRPAPGETREDNPLDETARLARTVVADILGRLGLAAEITLVRLGSRLVVNLDGPDRALLIGARGVTLEALQLLAAKILARKNPDHSVRLVLDVSDYRFRRHSQVMEELRTQAETARRTGRPQTLQGLGAAERRMVHLALRPVKDIELKAGRDRDSLVLEPAGARRRRKMKTK